MVLDRLQQLSHHIEGASPPPHPFDPLSTAEIEAAVALVRKHHAGSLKFNGVSLHEPRKAMMTAWLANPQRSPRPHRSAEVVAMAAGGNVYDGVVDLTERKVVEWTTVAEGVQPLLTLEELGVVEELVRKDERIIQQCEILGIPREDMDKVYCDRKSHSLSLPGGVTGASARLTRHSMVYWIR